MKKKLALCVRLSSLGDIINTLPAIRELNKIYTIHYLTETRFKDLIVGNPLIEKAILFPLTEIKKQLRNPLTLTAGTKTYSDYVRSLSKVRYDTIFDFHTSLKSIISTIGSKYKVKKGFGRHDSYEFAHLLYKNRISTDGKLLHRQDKFALLAGVTLPDQIKIVLPPVKNKSPFNNYIVAHAGTSKHGESKRWPIDYWAKLANRIYSNLGIKIVLTWSKAEEQLVNTIHNKSKEATIVSPATKTIHELRAIIINSRMFVSCDTGPLHLACADEVLSIGLFGPKNPAIYAPRGNYFNLIQSRTKEMSDIQPEEIYALIKQIL